VIFSVPETAFNLVSFTLFLFSPFGGGVLMTSFSPQWFKSVSNLMLLECFPVFPVTVNFISSYIRRLVTEKALILFELCWNTMSLRKIIWRDMIQEYKSIHIG